MKISVHFKHDDRCKCSCSLIKRTVKSEGRKADAKRAQDLAEIEKDVQLMELRLTNGDLAETCRQSLTVLHDHCKGWLAQDRKSASAKQVREKKEEIAAALDEIIEKNDEEGNA